MRKGLLVLGGFLVILTILLSVLLTQVKEPVKADPGYFDCRGCQYKSDKDRVNTEDPAWNKLARTDHGYCGRKNGMGCPNFCC
jgi:hypothetical protein